MKVLLLLLAYLAVGFVFLGMALELAEEEPSAFEIVVGGAFVILCWPIEREPERILKTECREKDDMARFAHGDWCYTLGKIQTRISCSTGNLD